MKQFRLLEGFGPPGEPRCLHTGEHAIVTLDNGVTIGAANHAGIEHVNASVVVDLAGVAHEHPRPVFSLYGETGNDVLQAFVAERRRSYAVLRILWPDLAMPPVSLRSPMDWRALLDALRHERHVVVCCHGGHGRTGTALAAILLVLRQARSAEEAIATVRSRHCERAVESDEQIAYLANLAKLV